MMRGSKKKHKQLAKKKRARYSQKLDKQIEAAVKRVVDEYGEVLQKLGKQ